MYAIGFFKIIYYVFQQLKLVGKNLIELVPHKSIKAILLKKNETRYIDYLHFNLERGYSKQSLVI